jgi:hypothetical protein
LVNKRISSRYGLTDYFFSFRYCMEKKSLPHVAELAKTATVELMVHPENPPELAYLQGDEYAEVFQGVVQATFGQLSHCCPS